MSRGNAVLPAIQIADEFAGNDTTPAGLAAGRLTLAGNATRANATGLLTYAAQPANNETVTIGSRVYTYKTTLTGAANEVKIGVDAETSRDNLVDAIMGNAGAGTTYGTGTVAHAQVLAAQGGSASTLRVTARAVGTGGNAIATTETCAQLSWGAATLAGGATPETVTIGDLVYRLVDVPVQAYDVLIGVTASSTIDHLVDAIMLTALGGYYEPGTAGQPDVSAVNGTGDVLDVTALVAGEDANAIVTTETMAQGSWGAATLTGGEMSGARLPRTSRTSKGWVIVKRGAGGSGAVTVANAYLRGLLDNGETEDDEDDGESFIRFADLGSMNIAAGEDGIAKLVEGAACFKRLAFNSDAISSDTVDVYYLPVAD